ncbi:hypothetical protein GmHk_14G041127 [Glycine max]|nr:hypothetical protein GmHk_14G041127 [Glycine max]
MCLVFVCDEEERVLGRQTAPGACPYCGGMVQAIDVESQWRFCFLPLCFKTKRKYYCTMCTRRLETNTIPGNPTFVEFALMAFVVELVIICCNSVCNIGINADGTCKIDEGVKRKVFKYKFETI